MNDRPHIKKINGIPNFTSPFISERNRIGKNLLADLLTRDLTLNYVLSQRTDFPIAACFNVHTYCNEACVMCPYEDVYASSKNHKLMSIENFRKILREFVDLGGRISTFNNFSDIFAHRLGVEYIKVILNEFKEIQLYLVTNGIGMLPRKIDEVFSNGFDGIVYVSCHAFTSETFLKVTKRDAFELVKSNIEYLASKHPHPERIIIQYAVDYSSEQEIENAKMHWQSLGVTLNRFGTHTFAGNSNHREEKIKNGKLAGCAGWGTDAGQPFYQIVFQANGDVTLCCHDLLGSVILGNALRDGVYNSWNSEEFKTLINDLYLGASNDPNFICRKCSMAIIK